MLQLLFLCTIEENINSIINLFIYIYKITLSILNLFSKYLFLYKSNKNLINYIIGNVSLILAFSIVGSFSIISCVGMKYINFSWMTTPIPKTIDRGKFLATLLWSTSGSLKYKLLYR